MDELMYGVILMANMENLLSAPPENKSRKPKRFPDVNSRGNPFGKIKKVRKYGLSK